MKIIGNEKWLFNEKIFKSMKVNFSKNIQLKSFVTVLLDIPFALPLHNLDSYTFYYKENLVGICTETIEEPLYILGKENNGLIHYKSKIEIIFLLNKHITKEASESLAHHYLDLSLEVINYIIDILVIYQHSHLISRLSRMDLPIMIPVRSIRSKNFKEEMIDEYGMMNLYDMSECIPPNYIVGEKRMEFLSQLENHKLNPYHHSTVYLREAYYQLNRGGFNQSIIFTQTSLEVFFSTLMRQIFLNEGKRTTKGIDNVFKAGYKNWMNDHLSRYFNDEGYKFLFSHKDDLDEENILFKYIEDIYIKRNDMVHKGINFSELDSLNAYKRAEVIYKKTAEIINNSELRKLAYPRELIDISLIK